MTISEKPRRNWLPILGLVGLMVWHGWLTLGLFGAEDPVGQLINDQPLVSGMHPLHQYHGYLGAQAILNTGRCCCYDPSFQAGYPKTPIFDSGSRFAEFFLIIGGGEFNPAAYKIGLALLIFAIPLLLVVAAWGIGLDTWENLVIGTLAVLVVWGSAARALLETGEIDLLFASVILLAQIGLLNRFDRHPGFFTWLSLLLLGSMGWFAHPLLFALFVPLLLIYYLNAGVKHRVLFWHLALWSSQVVALAINFIWLQEWLVHWWIRSPPLPSTDLLNHRTFRTFWNAPIWGIAADRALTLALVIGSFLGLICFHRQKKQRTTGRLLLLGGSVLFTLALLGISWEPLGRVGTAGLIVPALLFLCLAAGKAGVQISKGIIHLPVKPVFRWSLGVAFLSGLACYAYPFFPVFLERASGPQPLKIGVDDDQLAILELLKTHTTDKARILWEDVPVKAGRDGWTALLPLFTQRSFIGGLDPEGRIVHSHSGFVHSLLAGHSLPHWTDAALADYCRRYNIGWVVAWSNPAIQRFQAWKSGAEEVCELNNGNKGYLFKIKQNQQTFALHGHADVLQANAQRVVLTNVVPRDGKVVLSFHYQSGLSVTPSRVKAEKETDAMDSIPLLRLRMDSPVSVITITWDQQ